MKSADAAKRREEIIEAARAVGVTIGTGTPATSDTDLLAIATDCASNRARLPELVARCRALPPLEYDQLRRSLAEAAGLSRVAALDAEVRPPKDGTARTSPGLVTVEPCAESVNIAELLDDVSRFLRRFVYAPQYVHDAVALHIAFSHALDAFGIAPRAFVTAPEKACGKSLYLEVIAALSQRPLVASSVSDALLPRVVEKYQPTVLLDEIDTYALNERPSLAGVLNSGHLRSAALAWKTAGDNHEPTPFSTWAPYYFAGIAGKMPETTLSRCIVIPLGRKPASENVERFGRRQRREAALLASRLARFAADHLEALRVLDEREDDAIRLPKVGSDRDVDNWRPLLAVAEIGGSDWLERGYRAAESLSGAVPEPEGLGPLLLEDLRSVFLDSAGPDSEPRPDAEVPVALATADIIERLLGDPFAERPWRELRRGKPTDAASLSRLLKPYGIRSQNIRTHGVQAKGYRLEDLRLVFEQYCRPTPAGERPDVPEGENAGEGRYGSANWDASRSPGRTSQTANLGSRDEGRPETPPADEGVTL